MALVGRAARERRQAEASKAGLLWLDISNPSIEHTLPGVDYVKQRVFSIPLRLPGKNGPLDQFMPISVDKAKALVS